MKSGLIANPCVEVTPATELTRVGVELVDHKPHHGHRSKDVQNQHGYCGDSMCPVIDRLRKIDTADRCPRTLTFQESGYSFRLLIDSTCSKPINACEAELVFGGSNRLACALSRDWLFEQVGITLPSKLLPSDAGDHFSALNTLVGELFRPFIQVIDSTFIGVEGIHLDGRSPDVNPQTNSNMVGLSFFSDVDPTFNDPIVSVEMSRQRLDHLWYSIHRKSHEWLRNCSVLAPLLSLDYELRLFSWPLQPSDKKSLEVGGLLRLIQRTEFGQPVLKSVLSAQHQVASYVDIKIKEYDVEFIKDSDNIPVTEELLNPTHSLSFRLAGESISLADLATLGPGDRLNVHSSAWPMVDIMSGHQMIGRGELVVFNGEIAVQISALGNVIDQPEIGSESHHAVV